MQLTELQGKHAAMLRKEAASARSETKRAKAKAAQLGKERAAEMRGVAAAQAKAHNMMEAAQREMQQLEKTREKQAKAAAVSVALAERRADVEAAAAEKAAQREVKEARQLAASAQVHEEKARQSAAAEVKAAEIARGEASAAAHEQMLTKRKLERASVQLSHVQKLEQLKVGRAHAKIARLEGALASPSPSTTKGPSRTDEEWQGLSKDAYRKARYRERLSFLALHKVCWRLGVGCVCGGGYPSPIQTYLAHCLRNTTLMSKTLFTF